MLEKALILAAKAHTGQVDKGGAPYILHPIRVMLACKGEKERIIALLHDTLEDTALTAADLRREGFPEEIVQAVLCLTRRQGESYMEYIAHVCENPLAARVKYADLQDNLDLSRIPNPTEKDFARIRKYEQAMKEIRRTIREDEGMENWTKERYDAFLKELYAQQDEPYRQFHARLLRSALPVIGLRAPVLRKIAAKIAKEDGIGFLRICGRKTYEERLLYGLVAAELPVSYEEFLPYCDTYTETIVENWAHCDAFCSALKKRLKGHETEFFEHIKGYLASENPWAVRVGLVLMLDHYLTPAYLPAVLERTDAVRSEHYYVRMGQAWLLATAWAKDRDACMAYLSHHHLDDWTFHRFIRKACESYRVSAEDKAYLRSLRKK